MRRGLLGEPVRLSPAQPQNAEQRGALLGLRHILADCKVHGPKRYVELVNDLVGDAQIAGEVEVLTFQLQSDRHLRPIPGADFGERVGVGEP